MLLRPSHDIEVLNNRLDVVEFSYNPRNDEMIKYMGDHLKCIKSINVSFVSCYFYLVALLDSFH